MMSFARLLLILSIAAGPAAAAQDYPARPVRVVVPFAAGGPGDVIARLVAQQLAERLGKPFVVENAPGAGGNLGTGQVARAAPDGHTLLVASSHFTINPSLYGKVPYNPEKDFVPITLIATSPNVLVVHPSKPARTVADLVAAIRAAPETKTYAMPGAGTPAHLSGEMFRVALKLNLVAVPFGGGGPMIQSVLGGHTPVAFSSMPPAAAHIKAGTLRGLAVTSERRSPTLPDVPTMAESGFVGQVGATPQGLFAPAGTPATVVDTLYREIVRIVTLPEVRDKLSAIGFEPIANAPEDFARDLAAEIPKWSALIKDAGLSVQQ